jgi:hypothetical protein
MQDGDAGDLLILAWVLRTRRANCQISNTNQYQIWVVDVVRLPSTSDEADWNERALPESFLDGISVEHAWILPVGVHCTEPYGTT